MQEWIKIIGAGLLVGVVAGTATGDIKDDVVTSCIAHNADQGSSGALTTSFCLCSAELTASKANIFHKVGYKIGLLDLNTPFSLGKKFGEEVDKVCNALK